MEGGEQEEVGQGGALAGRGPEGAEGVEGAGAGGGEPEGAGQAEVAGGGLEGDGGGLLLEQGLDALGGAEVGLADDAGLAVDALGDGDVVVELLVLALADDGGHIGQYYLAGISELTKTMQNGRKDCTLRQI